MGKDRAAGRVGSDFLSAIAGRVGSTFSSGRVQEKRPVDNSAVTDHRVYLLYYVNSK